MTDTNHLLEDTPFNRLDNAADEAAIELEERIDDLQSALFRLADARADGDQEWIKDVIEEINLVLNK